MPTAAGCKPAVFYRSQTTKVCKARAIFPFVFPSEALKLSESSQMGADLSAGAIQTPSIPALCSHTCCNWNCILIHRGQISLPRAWLGSAARLTSQHAAFAAVTAAVPRRTPFSLALILAPFRSSQRSCAVCSFIHPRLLPATSLSGPRREDLAARPASSALCSFVMQQIKHQCTSI